jgi:hypothetical protein
MRGDPWGENGSDGQRFRDPEEERREREQAEAGPGVSEKF